MKKINFLSSTKLLMATIGLILGAFTLLSMSFPYDPAYTGPNVNGPKMAHWKTSSCGSDTYHNKVDYAESKAVTTGNGSVSVSGTNSNSNAKTGESVVESGRNANDEVVLTWNCGYTTTDQTGQDEGLASKHSNTVTFKANPNPGYQFSEWKDKNGTRLSTENPCEATFSMEGIDYSKTSESSATNYSSTPYKSTVYYAYFTPITVTAVDKASVSVDPTNPLTSCADYTGTVTFTSDGADELVDFVSNGAVLVDKTGNGIFTVNSVDKLDRNNVQANWTFTGSGTYGGTTNPRNRQNSTKIRLTSKGDASSYKECTITANFPAVTFEGDDVEVYTDYSAGVTANQAVITVLYADDAQDFTTALNSLSLTNITGASGTWSLGTITMSATDYATGKATLTIPYTFTPTGGTTTGVTTADLVITANAAAGGTSRTITFSAYVEAPETKEASVTINDVETKYDHLLGAGGALEAANAATNATLKLLMDVDVTTPVAITKSMTLDLNSKTLSSTITSTDKSAVDIKNGAQVTLKSGRAGGKIIVNGNVAGRMSAVQVTKGALNFVSGDIIISNTNTGATSSTPYAAGVYLASSAWSGGRPTSMMSMSGGSITSSRTGASGKYVYGIYCDGTGTSASSIDLTGGTIHVTYANGGYAMGVYAAGSSTIQNMDISAEGKNYTYAIRQNDGKLVVNGGDYVVSGENSRTVFTDADLSILDGRFTASSTTSGAVALAVRKGNTVVNGGSFSATAATTGAVGLAYQAADLTVKVNGGSFNATAATAATGADLSQTGAVLITTAGSFTATVTGTSASVQSYGMKLAAGSTATVSGTEFSGLTTGAAAVTASSNSNSTPNGAYGILSAGTLNVEKCTIIGQSAKSYAYGIYAQGATTIENSKVTGTVPTGDRGTALYINGASATVTADNTTFTGLAGTTYTYGSYVLKGQLDATNCVFAATSKQNSATAAAKCYGRGIYHASGTKVNLIGGSVLVDGNASYSQESFGVYSEGECTIDGTTVTVQDVKDGNALYASTANGSLVVESGKFLSVSSALKVNSPKSVLLKGGRYSHKDNIAASYMPAGYKVFDIPATTQDYADGYKFTVSTVDNPGFAVCQNVQTKKEYNTLAEALQEVTSGQTILMTFDYTLPAGNYSLPAGATLLVPRAADQTSANKSTPKRVNTAISTATLYRTLTLATGANLVVYGEVELSATQMASGNADCSGYVTGGYGMLKMEEGAQMIFESGANFYAWGYAVGTGVIDIKNGAKSYEMFQLGWFKGGNTTKAAATNNRYKVFPFTDFAYQNIECPIIYRPGAQGLGSGALYAQNTQIKVDNVRLVGTTNDSFFKMTVEGAGEDTWVRKEYDAKTDMTNWYMNSGATLSGMTMNVGVTVTTSDFYLPIPSNFSIILNYGDVNFGNDTEFLPGSRLIVNKEARGILPSGKKLFFVDNEDWFVGRSKYYYPVNYSPSWKAATGKTTNPRLDQYAQTSAKRATLPPLPDAELFLHGELILSGSLYTTGDGTENRGSNIHSTNADAGKIKFRATAPTADLPMYKITTEYGATSGKGWSDMIKGGDFTATPARLKNGTEYDTEFTSTSGVVAGKTFMYKDDHWILSYEEGCFMVEEDGDVKHYYAHPADFVEVTSKDEDAHHLYHDAETETRTFIVEEGCVWWEVESSAYDGDKYKTVVPDHNGDYKYYQYVSGNWQEARVNVNWYNGSTKLATYNMLYKKAPKYIDATPKKTKQGHAAFAYDGWVLAQVDELSTTATVYQNGELPIATEDISYYAHYTIVPDQYYITFYDESGKILQQGAQKATTTETPITALRPVFSGIIPTIEATEAAQYDFDGWNTAPNGGGIHYAADALPEITAPASYYAHYKETPRLYTIKFVNYNGDVLQTGEVAYGTAPAYTEAEPTRANSGFWSYNFKGWNDKAGNYYAKSATLPTVSGNATYTAQYDETDWTPEYTIIFKDGDGNVLSTQYVRQNVMPVYAGVTPTKSEDAGYTYAFNDSWSEPIVPATANKTYIALFDATIKQYTITFKNYDGTVLQTGKVDYDVVPTYIGTTPIKAATSEYVYTFNTWTPAIAAVCGDATYTATFSPTANVHSLTVSMEDADAGSLSQTTINNIPDGSKVTIKGNQFTVNGTTVTATPNSTSLYYTYIFDRWNNLPATITSDVTNAKAIFTKRTRQYTVTFKNGSDVVKTGDYDYASVIEAPADPVKAGYIFNGWYNGEVKFVAGTTVPVGGIIYQARWTEIPLSEDIVATTAVTVTESKKVNNLTISENGSVTITDNAQVTVVENLLLEATPDNNLGAVLSGNIQVQGNAFIDINMNGSGTMNKNYYYSFAVPFSVDVNGGVFRMENGNAVPMTPGVGFLAYKYNEATRATKGTDDSAWESVDSGTFEPGVFYLILFSSNKSNTYRFQWNGNGSVNNHADISVTTTGNDATNSGWHGVANNGLGYSTMTGSFPALQTLNSQNNAFDVVEKTEAIAIANPVFVQMATGTIDLSTPTVHAAAAPRRTVEEEATELMNVRLIREGANKHDDQIFFSANEEAENQYTLGKDVAKMFMGTAKTAQLWINAYGERLVANEMTMTGNTASADLSFYAPAAASYLLHLKDIPADTRVYLTNEGMVVWDLSMSDYMLDLSAGTNEGYGLLITKNRISTGMEDATIDACHQTKKVLINHVLYIIRNGRVYDANGKEIKR